MRVRQRSAPPPGATGSRPCSPCWPTEGFNLQLDYLPLHSGAQIVIRKPKAEPEAGFDAVGDVLVERQIARKSA
jgi:hypothetical protein